MAVTVIDRDGNSVVDVVVVVVPAAAGTVRAPLATHAAITQMGMRFVPAVTVVRVGARLNFTDNDLWEHHARGSVAGMVQFTAGTSGGFELRLLGKTPGQ